MLENELTDKQEKYWSIPNEKVIWEGQPLIQWYIIKAILILSIVLVIFLVFLSEIDNNFLASVMAMIVITGTFIFPPLYFIYDYFKIKAKYKYVLLSNFLMIKAGNKLTTKYFKLDDIKDFELRNQKIIVHLRNKIRNPYLTLIYMRTKTLKIGPFENAEGIYNILNQHLLDYKSNTENK